MNEEGSPEGPLSAKPSERGSPATRSLRKRVMGTLVPAVIGGVIGAAYARYSLPPNFFAESSLPAMYATGGAAIMILAVRLSAILRVMLEDYRGTRPKDPGT